MRKSQSPAQQSPSRAQVPPSATQTPAPAVQVPIGTQLPVPFSDVSHVPEQHSSSIAHGPVGAQPGAYSGVAHAPEQQSSSTPQGARRAAHAATVSTQMPSWQVASATHGLPPLQSPSISTAPFAGGMQVPPQLAIAPLSGWQGPEQLSLAHSTSSLQGVPSGFGGAT